MKQLLFISIISLSLLFSSCGNKESKQADATANNQSETSTDLSNVSTDSKTTTLSSALDSVSYALGVDLGNQLSNAPQNFDLAIVAQAINDVDNRKAKMTRESAIVYMQKYQQQEAQNQFEHNKIAGENFLKENKGKPGVTTLPSGLQYKIVKKGTGPKPKETDVVEVHYKGTLIDGTEFDSSYSRGETATFPLTGVIKGWTEGLQHINEGSKVIFYIPQELAYGATPHSGGPIEPYMALIFEIELIKVMPQN